MWAPPPPVPAVNRAQPPAPSKKPMRFTSTGRKPLNTQAQPRAQMKAVTSEDLYNLRELMRTKYTRDVEVYSLRKAYRANLHIKEEAQRKADQAMQEIARRVAAWDLDNTWDSEERELVKDIQERLGLKYSAVYSDASSSLGDSSSRFEHLSMSDAR